MLKPTVDDAVKEARKGRSVLIPTDSRKWEVAEAVMHHSGVRIAFVDDGILVSKAE